MKRISLTLATPNESGTYHRTLWYNKYDASAQKIATGHPLKQVNRGPGIFGRLCFSTNFSTCFLHIVQTHSKKCYYIYILQIRKFSTPLSCTTGRASAKSVHEKYSELCASSTVSYPFDNKQDTPPQIPRGNKHTN